MLHPSQTVPPRPATGDPAVPGQLAAPDDEATGTARLVVEPWWDPDLAVTGHDLRDPYVERFWLGVVGPSTLLLLRRFARGFDELPGGFRVDVAETARALGLGAGTGRHAPLLRAVDRACNFGLARRNGPGTVAVRTHLPDVPPHRLARLPASVRAAHDRWQGATGRV